MLKSNLVLLFIKRSCVLSILNMNISQPKEWWSLILFSLIILVSILLGIQTVFNSCDNNDIIDEPESTLVSKILLLGDFRVEVGRLDL